MPTFLTKSDETILKSIKIDQEILMRKKIVVRLHLVCLVFIRKILHLIDQPQKQISLSLNNMGYQ